MKKKYLAMVHGELKDELRIDAPLLRYDDEKSALVRMVVKVDPSGKESLTFVKPLKYFPDTNTTLVECSPHTGRQHQIRVHMKYSGHTLFNDERYGGNLILKGTTFTKYKQFIDNCFKTLPRQALHAKTLGFEHPTTKEFMSFDTEIPNDMKECIEKWRNYAKSNATDTDEE